ncbi:hypothetical protein CoNPh26_CDS0018 [Staphylococcus phage S-CoN_Ph26]|nr:hypothetical protein CoNPh26_CDS0018 [Staphylococcus phage S-CoN_Ph26]
MIKKLIRLWFTIAMYELGKWIGREVYYKLTANDEVEVPSDYAINTDQQDINEDFVGCLNEGRMIKLLILNKRNKSR